MRVCVWERKCVSVCASAVHIVGCVCLSVGSTARIYPHDLKPTRVLIEAYYTTGAQQLHNRPKIQRRGVSLWAQTAHPHVLHPLFVLLLSGYHRPLSRYVIIIMLLDMFIDIYDIWPFTYILHVHSAI